MPGPGFPAIKRKLPRRNTTGGGGAVPPATKLPEGAHNATPPSSGRRVSASPRAASVSSFSGGLDGKGYVTVEQYKREIERLNGVLQEERQAASRLREAARSDADALRGEIDRARRRGEEKAAGAVRAALAAAEALKAALAEARRERDEARAALRAASDQLGAGRASRGAISDAMARLQASHLAVLQVADAKVKALAQRFEALRANAAAASAAWGKREGRFNAEAAQLRDEAARARAELAGAEARAHDLAAGRDHDRSAADAATARVAAAAEAARGENAGLRARLAEAEAAAARGAAAEAAARAAVAAQGAAEAARDEALRALEAAAAVADAATRGEAARAKEAADAETRRLRRRRDGGTQTAAAEPPAPAQPTVPLEAMLELEASIADELTALRRFSHTHDLIKISTITEHESAIDALKVKCAAAKEREQVLNFCLNTAEKHVQKADAATAGRLAESRKARLAKVDAGLRTNLSDLDQRSRSQSIMSTDRLREMLPKAKERQLHATERRRKSVGVVWAGSENGGNPTGDAGKENGGGKAAGAAGAGPFGKKANNKSPLSPMMLKGPAGLRDVSPIRKAGLLLPMASKGQ